ncbi:MAG: ferrochelatase [Streptosporangiaceae bacterium]
MTGPGYDALLLVSFGGPEGPEDVIPFLENVTRGRGVPAKRLREVAEHYYRLGGSPINAQSRALRDAIAGDFRKHHVGLPVYWGNRNWHPFLVDALREMATDGVRQALAFVTAAYSSYSSCRQYREDIARAQEEVRAEKDAVAPRVDKLRHFFNHPGFVEPMAANVRRALAVLPEEQRDRAHLVFTAHSVPVSMAESSGPAGGDYVRQLSETAALIAERVSPPDLPWQLVFQSRSGHPSQPWLEPDVCDHLIDLHAKGVDAVVVVPIGFVSDHVEVIHDLDDEAGSVARVRGMSFVRAATLGPDPRFVAMVRGLVSERTEPGVARPTLGGLGASHDACPAGCCPNPRGPPPAAAGASG